MHFFDHAIEQTRVDMHGHIVGSAAERWKSTLLVTTMLASVAAAFMRTETARMSKVIKEAGIRAE